MTWAPDYVDEELFKSYLKLGSNADDTFVATWITTVSRNVDDFCRRQFGQVEAAEDRYFPVRLDHADRAWWAEIDDLYDGSGLTIADSYGTAITGGWELWPRNAAVKGRPYERVRLTTGLSWSYCGDLTFNSDKWGWASVPASVRTGLLLQGHRLAKRRDSPFGVAGSPQEQGQVLLLAQLDPDFRTSLAPFQRDWWAR